MVKTAGMEFFCYHRDRPGSVTISFTDGSNWEFEVSPLVSGTVVRVAHALGY